MSGAQTADVDDRQPPSPVTVDGEIARLARLNGWKPKEEFRGDPTGWVDADVFMARAAETPAIMRKNNETLAGRLERMERAHSHTVATLQTRLDETLGTVATMTTMMRSAETRGYERARRELKAEMAKAVAFADTETYNRAQADLDELERNKPAEPPKKPDAAATPATPAPQGQPDPAVTRFYADNAWYDPAGRSATRDQEMMTMADGIHAALLKDRPDMTMAQNLAEVQRRVRQLFPDRFPGAQMSAATQTEEQGTVRQPGANTTTTDRREDPSSVSPSSPGAPRRTVQRRSFDAMPKEAKDAYVRYDQQLKSFSEQRGNKHDPLSKEEWAADYWSQFPDDGG